MFAATGDGTLLPLYVIYKAKHLYDLWSEGGPAGARFNRSKSGWMDGSCFLDWFESIMIPYFRCFGGRKAIIVDNLSSNLSPAVIDLCKKHDIECVFLPSNSTHLTQALDVAIFRPLKQAWRQVLENWKSRTNKCSGIDKKYFPRLLKETLDML
ncbi:MFS-type transporter clz9-like [Schistocerca piceifrons]|uniref:MFS-type transporter clz9-like n=1 Tax=Schistocerca piceifrons TaxID=274613 RepID=UPI001F5FE1DA|nr:MFS-type transporter clz9-like [Schistocerca piceifrons]